MLDQVETKDETSEFKIEELFYSRTDKRGIIQSGNTVFQRVSKYSAAELLGAPHKIVRHPDMPMAMFYVMWDMLKRDKPVGAYVKNRAKDGSYYWVFAMTTPIDGGYLSIRQRPTSDMLAKIEPLYIEVRNRELTEDVSAEDSAEYLIQRLKEIGWASYTEYMTDALIAESAARQKAIGRSFDTQMGEIITLKENAVSTLEIAQKVLDDFSTIAGFPVNMHIQASKLKANGRIFGSIADNYQRLSQRVESLMRDFIDVRKDASDTVDQGLFSLMVALTQGEMGQQCQEELDQYRMMGGGDREDEPQLDLSAEIPMLEAQRKANQAHSVEGLIAIISEFKKFSRLIDDMTGVLSALSVTQFVGLVETARLNQNGETLKAMLQDVTGVQNQAQENLKKLETLNREITSKVSRLSKSLTAMP